MNHLPRLLFMLIPTTVLLFVAAGTAVSTRPQNHLELADPRSARAGMPVDVAGVFNRACKDCHSGSTSWPWYAKLPPISLAIAGDVHRGRSFLNVSEWASYSRGRKLGVLSAIPLAVAKSNMPPRVYRLMHRDSNLTVQERELLANWALAERVRLRSNPPN